MSPGRVLAFVLATALALAGLLTATTASGSAPSSIQPRVVSALPPTTYAIIKTVDPGVFPMGVTVDDIDDTIYVANYGTSSGSTWKLASIRGRRRAGGSRRSSQCVRRCR